MHLFFFLQKSIIGMHSSLSVTILSVVLLMNYGQFVEGSICSNPQSYAGKVVKDPFGGQAGQCVSFVKVTANCRHLLLSFVI